MLLIIFFIKILQIQVIRHTIVMIQMNDVEVGGGNEVSAILVEITEQATHQNEKNVDEMSLTMKT